MWHHKCNGWHRGWLLYESEDENEAEVDSPDTDWDLYYDETVNDDLYDELIALDDDDSSNFE